MNIALVIPAFRPGPPLIELVGKLAQTPLPVIVIVDDGSGPQYRQVFDECRRCPRVEVLPHAINLGKGAALKTGINHVLCSFPGYGVVTADADGQHDAEDILKVARALAERPECLVLGAREFGRQAPRRSRIGNVFTRGVLRLVLGQRLADTQTGLRGIAPRMLPRLLEIASSGYEFELDMLIAAKHHACPVVEVGIKTIYIEDNRASHFDPLLDSMRIYFVLLRFSIVSLLTAGVDNLVFWMFFGLRGSVLEAQAAGRAAAVAFNYGAARRAVFLSRERHEIVLPKYLLLVLASGVASYGLIQFFRATLALPVIGAKVLAESLLFIANFAIQRDFVFTRRAGEPAATDWDRYYTSTPFTAKIMRRYTTAVLVSALKKFCGTARDIVEIGGANSCFLDRIVRELRPRAYHVIDNNQYGLDLLRQRLAAQDGGGPEVLLHRQDVLDLSLRARADAVFSVGLIEHFTTEGTRKAVLSHFGLLKPGGCAILSFPTPTWLYRAARSIMETLGLWRFPDERPLARGEVMESIAGVGDVVFEKTLWPLVFTQHLMVIRKRGLPV